MRISPPQFDVSGNTAGDDDGSVVGKRQRVDGAVSMGVRFGEGEREMEIDGGVGSLQGKEEEDGQGVVSVNDDHGSSDSDSDSGVPPIDATLVGMSDSSDDDEDDDT